MPFHDDLLRQAVQLVHKVPKNPKQVSLRRAVSAAYYALFHFLISETIANWNRPAARGKLARAFDHRSMKRASNRLLDPHLFPFNGEPSTTVETLRSIAKTFTQLQEKRHIADDDNTTEWTRIEALAEVKLAEQAFVKWKRIRNEPIAQAYLVSLLVKDRD